MPPETGELRLNHIEQAPSLGGVVNQYVDDVGKLPIGLIGPRTFIAAKALILFASVRDMPQGARIGWVAGPSSMHSGIIGSVGRACYSLS